MEEDAHYVYELLMAQFDGKCESKDIFLFERFEVLIFAPKWCFGASF